MAKGDDSVRRKKNKVLRKKLQKGPSSVSARVASIIASKKRRKSGKRRICEGMCFSLPTAGDPFNDRQGKIDFNGKEKGKRAPSQADRKLSINNNSVPIKKGKVGIGRNRIKNGHVAKDLGCPSKFLIMCLDRIQTALQLDGIYNNAENQPLFFNTWGVEFWKCFHVGCDILETNGSGPAMEQIAWVASNAADIIARKEEEGQSFDWPFLLFLVPSQEKANKVRSVCKPLKSLDIRTVSLHSGASIDHQIRGLKSCTPEILVSMPERLLELMALNAIDVSGVFAMVVDGQEILSGGGYVDMIKSIRQSTPQSVHTMVFSDCLSSASVNMVQSVLTGPICRLCFNGSIRSQSACVLQSVHVFSHEEKLLQGVEVLSKACGNQLSHPSKFLIVVWKDEKSHKLASALESKGYSVPFSINLEATNRGGRSRREGRREGQRFDTCKGSRQSSKRNPAVSVISVENIHTTNIEDYEVVIIPDFVPSIDDYVQILTRMARHTVNGVLQSFFTSDNAMLAGPLIGILEECGQAVPDSLRNITHF